MSHNIHSNARTTPIIRREIRESALSAGTLATKYNVTEQTARKWKNREDVEDKSHRPHTLQTTLSSEQEAIVIELRKTLLLPLDDLVAITKEFINKDASRSGIGRCLARHKVSRLKDLIPEEEKIKKPSKSFKDYVPGFVHVDLKYLPKMPDQRSRSYLFVGIDRATRWVYMEVLPDKSAKQAEQFLKRLIAKAPFVISKVLTDNGKEFTDRFCATGKRQPTGNHVFDKVCDTNDIEHRLIKPRHPQTNGMVERFNGRIAELVNQTRFSSIAQLTETMNQYLKIYNNYIPQRALDHKPPVEAIKKWQSESPEIFKKKVYKQAGLDI